MPEKPLIPEPGTPEPARNTSGQRQDHNSSFHLESGFIERVDTTATGYTKLERDVLYSTVKGAKARIIAAYPTLKLIREIVDPFQFPWAFRHWGTQDVFTTRSLGQDSLIPAKYRRLVKHVETNQSVDADRTFPTGLVGDQAFIEQAQQTIEEARLKIITEIIDESTDPLLGHEDSEFGSVSIRESIVDDGTAIDSGINVLKSTVTPLGNGKSIKTTASYDQDITTLNSKRKSLGQDNLIPEKYRRLVKHIETDSFVSPSYNFPTGLTGDQTQIKMAQETIARARQTIVEEVIDVSQDPLLGGETGEWGPYSVYETIVEDGTLIEEGFLIAKSTVTPLGNGKSIKITVKYPADLASRSVTEQDYDQRLDINFTTVRSIKARGTTIGTSKCDVKVIDYYRESVVQHGGNITVLDTFIQSMAATTNIDMPDRLLGIVPVADSGSGAGSSSTFVNATLTGDGNLNTGTSANAQSSGYSTVEAAPIIDQFYGNELPAMFHHVYMPNGATYASVLSHLATLLGITIIAKPNFNPRLETVVTSGGRFSARTGRSHMRGVSRHGDDEGTSESIGLSYGREVGGSTHKTIISPTIHDFIPISGSISVIVEDDTSSTTATGRVVSGQIPATSGAVTWPSTGNYLWRLRSAPFKLGYALYECLVWDAASYPGSSSAGTLYYYLPAYTRLTGGTATDLDTKTIASLAVNAIIEVDINLRGSSQWRKELWVGGVPATDADYGIIKPPDYNAVSMNYVLIRARGY